MRSNDHVSELFCSHNLREFMISEYDVKHTCAVDSKLWVRYSQRNQTSRVNRSFTYSEKEPGSSVNFIQLYTRGSMSGFGDSISIMHIRKFFKLHHDIVRFRFFPRIAKRSFSNK